MKLEAITLIGVVAAGLLQGQQVVPPAGVSKFDFSDTKFANKAAMNHMLEIKLGQYASKNAQNGEIRVFGDMMARDHAMSLDELRTIFKMKDHPEPKNLDGAHKAVWDRLTSKTGSEFDMAYRSTMIEAHREMLSMFKKAAKSAVDTELRDYAKNHLGQLKNHVQAAEKLPTNGL